jgi:hypothetical protein
VKWKRRKDRSLRVLWLLNHSTLMKFESDVLSRLGFEVFTPKILSRTLGFRSAGVDFGLDESLSLTSEDLQILNEFDFYGEKWTPLIREIVNREFDLVFVMPEGAQIPNAIAGFNGPIVLRAFGLFEDRSYFLSLSEMHGNELLYDLFARGNRFQFGQAYENLFEVEPLFLREHTMNLPIGLPDSFWLKEDSWTGRGGFVMAACPDISLSVYNGEQFREIKSCAGLHPLVVVGRQIVAVEDPAVTGFIADDELWRKYQEAAVFYYPSTEPRHVHYSPLEAMVVGLPVVLRSGSLLERLVGPGSVGVASSSVEARELIERLVDGDVSLGEQIRSSQAGAVDQLRITKCLPIWRESMRSLGLLDQGGFRRVFREQLRGQSILRNSLESTNDFRSHLGLPEWKSKTANPSEISYHFGLTRDPFVVRKLDGVSFGEEFGSWTISPNVEIEFRRPLPDRFILDLSFFGYGRNLNDEVTVSVGKTERQIVVERVGPCEPAVFKCEFANPSRTRSICLFIPHSEVPPGDNRSIGIGLVSLKIRPLPA